MNASTDSLPLASGPARVAPVHTTHRFKLLLQREYWEHRGGFLWAPLVAGGISLLLTLMFVVFALVAAGRLNGDSAKITLDNGTSMSINGLDLGKLTSSMSPSDMQQLGEGLNVSLLAASTWPFMVLIFVVFFYCLGALYDERKDRSVLFWKSLPVSDRETVLSKVVSAVLVAPLIATVIAVATMFGFLLIISAVVLFHGGNPVTLLWGPSSPMKLAFQLLAAVPVYALWAMPTVGWLLLCSAWARSKPFLWAVMLPVAAGVIVSWFGLMKFINLDSIWFWKNIVARGLTSIVPVTWMDIERISHASDGEAAALRNLLDVQAIYGNLASANLWIGVAVGVLMIVAAIRLRRWRDEG